MVARAHTITADAARSARWQQYHANPDRWFWDRVDCSGGEDACWPWQGRVMKARRGYGRLVFKGRSIGAHRMALLLSSDAASDGLYACHTCDNPPCCNPRHLFWGTPQDNVDDCIAKGRKRGAPRKINVERLLQRRNAGLSYSALAAEFGVHFASIGKALKRAALRARAISHQGGQNG